MSQRFSITVPDSIGKVIKKLAEIEGSKPTSVASFLVERVVKEGLETGKYPAQWAKLDSDSDGQSKPEIDHIDLNSITQSLLKLKRDNHLSSAEVSLLESILQVEPGSLKALINGDGEQIRAEK